MTPRRIPEDRHRCQAAVPGPFHHLPTPTYDRCPAKRVDGPLCRAHRRWKLQGGVVILYAEVEVKPCL